MASLHRFLGSLVLLALVFSVIHFPTAEGGGSSDVMVGGDKITVFESDDPNYEYPAKNINVKDRGTLFINSTAKVKVDQTADWQYSVVVEGFGTLHLNGGVLFSNYDVRMEIKGHATLVLENRASIEVTDFSASEQCSIFIGSGCTIEAVNMSVSCAQLNVSSSTLSDRTVQSAGELNILDETLFNLTVKEAGSVFVDSAKLAGASFGSVSGNMVFEDTTVEESFVGKCNGLVFGKGEEKGDSGCVITNLDAGEVSTAVVKHSTVQGLTLEECSRFEMKSCEFMGEQSELDALTEIPVFLAETSSFADLTLKFDANEEVTLKRISDARLELSGDGVLDVYGWTPTEKSEDGEQHTDGISVTGDGTVNVHRYLTVAVQDKDGKPVPEAAVKVLDTPDHAVVDEKKTDEDGKATFTLLGTIISRGDGGNLEEPVWFYRLDVTFDDKSSATDIQMPDDLSKVIDLDTVVEEEDEGLSATQWGMIAGALVLVVIIFWLMASKAGKKRKREPESGRKGRKR